jgi:hypothetical protein
MKKYKLLRTWIDKKRGNPYFPDEYFESQLPEEIRNDRYWCLPLDEIEVSFTTKPKDDSIIDLRINKPDNEISVTRQETIVEKDTSVKVNLNTAKLEDLLKVQGIGQTTAEKIIKNRPLKSLDSLSGFLKNPNQIDLTKIEI